MLEKLSDKQLLKVAEELEWSVRMVQHWTHVDVPSIVVDDDGYQGVMRPTASQVHEYDPYEAIRKAIRGLRSEEGLFFSIYRPVKKLADSPTWREACGDG